MITAIAWDSETGFLTTIGREDANILAETRFLGLGPQDPQKPGLLTKSGVRMPQLSKKSGFLDNDDSATS
ncbi:hypothetical protein Q5691_05795 [Microcoleus sp. w1-18aA5]